MSTYVVVVSFRVRPQDYVAVDDDPVSVGELVKAILRGDTEMPDQHDLKVYRESDA